MNIHPALPFALLLLCARFAEAATHLSCAPVFGDHAILQQGMDIPVRGKALPESVVRVKLGDQVSNEGKADANGDWVVTLPAMKATPLGALDATPAGLIMEISARHPQGDESLRFEDILIGEVWLCSGQSNIAGRVRHNSTGKGREDNLAKVNLPALREFEAGLGGWHPAVPPDVAQFSRVGLCFARELQRELKVPVGLLSASVGGTRIESWIKTDQPLDPQIQHQPGALYLKHIQPLIGTALRGAVWYQGEGNVKEGFAYLPLLTSLIEGWRGDWGQGDFPFLIVQLASIGESKAENPAMVENRAHIREAQREALRRIPNTGLACAIDTGGPKEHPPNKFETSFRLAQWALHHQYGRKDIVPSGPLFREVAVEGGAMRIRFDYADGLMIANKADYEMPVPSPDAPLPWLSIQAKAGSWHWAGAKIDGKDLLVSSKEVAEPVAVRYAWVNRPLGPYLYNAAGLPAFPFTTEKLEAK